jgi:hypothetical protein
LTLITLNNIDDGALTIHDFLPLSIGEGDEHQKYA